MTKLELNLQVENQNRHDENKTTNQIYLLDSNWNVNNKMVKKSLLSRTQPPQSAYRVNDHE